MLKAITENREVMKRGVQSALRGILLDIPRITQMESEINFIYNSQQKVVGYRYTFFYYFEGDENESTTT